MNKTKIIFYDIDQILGMGGPYIGKLKIENSNIISDDFFIAENYIVSDDKKLTILAKYYKAKWFRDNYFTIMVFNIEDNVKYESLEKFKIIHLKSINNNKINFYRANHDKIEKFKDEVIFNKSNFKLVG